MKIWAHTLVKNEERYLWYSVMSIINHVDKVLLWDTGSTDNSVKIIEEIKKRFPDKVDVNLHKNVTSDEFTLVRQEMLRKTKADWMIIVDGDEVWWDDAIARITNIIDKEGGYLETIVHRYFNLIGDIYHFQDEIAGRYKIDDVIGHLTFRAMNMKIPGIHFGKPHGQQGIFDESGKLLQFRLKEKRRFFDEKLYLHFTHLVRSKDRNEDLKVIKRKIKMKYEIGIQFPLDFYYPEVFFRDKPQFVDSVWKKMSPSYYAKSLVYTPLRYLKRRIIKNEKSGY